MIRRRHCVVGAAAIPLAAAARRARAATAAKVFRVGVLDPDPAAFAAQWKEFVAELARRGYVEGRNLVFERRYGEELHPAGVDKLALELVALEPDVLYAAHGTVSALALKKATKTSIVFFSSADPVGTGLVESLSARAATHRQLDLDLSSSKAWST
jgi:putative ABC transport system substrate-binding protein